MLFADAGYNVFTQEPITPVSLVFLMLQIVLNVFSMVFAETSLLFNCCFCLRLFVTNYVCVVPCGVM